ncbi:hypothetical protein EX30DRAFT_364372 [Ascodesmis nigricans]|uniref:Uncharacterized protein n=1 Tax=Ascodesmis nigricans TaxID=341454 RepID=A0A4S2MVR8_9PEZI|nr:hypothetical protein EX30DRAFT_364372 [Ascodesmis nigricans]
MFLRLLLSASPTSPSHSHTHIPGFTMTSTTNPPSQHASTGSTTSLPAHEDSTVHENCMTRLPYLSDIPGFRKVYDASCFCGSVQYDRCGATAGCKVVPLRDVPEVARRAVSMSEPTVLKMSAIFAKPSICFTLGTVNLRFTVPRLAYWTPHLRTQEHDLP